MNEEKTIAFRRRQAVRDQVRVAYGAVPVILKGFPESDPVRVKIRQRARAMLVEQGYLTAKEADTLPVNDAITAVLIRLRGEASRADPVRGSAPRSGRRSASSAVS